jgi:hypothetical protein
MGIASKQDEPATSRVERAASVRLAAKCHRVSRFLLVNFDPPVHRQIEEVGISLDRTFVWRRNNRLIRPPKGPRDLASMNDARDDRGQKQTMSL